MEPGDARGAGRDLAFPPHLAELAGADHAGEAERAERLVRRVRRRRQVGDHERLAVARQAGLQQEGELGVAVRHVRRALGQRDKDVGQRRQRLVDGLRLLEPLPRRVRLGQPLRTGQVHQVQRAVEGLSLAARRARPGDAQREDGVAARAADKMSEQPPCCMAFELSSTGERDSK